MQGHIESYDVDTQTGVIKDAQGFYNFHIEDWQAQVNPDVGDDVLFEINSDNKAVSINLAGGYLQAPKAVKYRYLAAFLALILGFVGVHRFYLGHYKMGFAQIAVTAITVGYGAMWGFIEAVLLVAGHIDKDAKGRPLK